MKNIKGELQNIILRDEQIGSDGQFKKIQNFPGRYAKTSISIKEQQRFKDEETAPLLAFATAKSLFYNHTISINTFISKGAEQTIGLTRRS